MLQRLAILLTGAMLLWACEPRLQNYYDNIPDLSLTVPEPVPIQKPVKIALVLGAGGSRGMAHIGVLDELEKANIKIDLIVGCSAGSLVGGLYAQTPCAHYLKNEFASLRRSDFVSIDWFSPCHGLGQGWGLKKFLLRHFGDVRFDELEIPMVIVATNLCDGELVVLAGGPVAPAVHASCAYPFIFSPVKLYNKILVDGGVANPIPVDIAKCYGAEIIIAVDLSNSLCESLPSNLCGVAARCSEIQFLLHSVNCVRDADVVIKPETGNIGPFDECDKEKVFQAGRIAARKALPDILRVIEEKSKKETNEKDDILSNQARSDRLEFTEKNPGAY